MNHFKIIALITVLFCSVDTMGQNTLRLGAYYFDGWTGKTSHVSDKLKSNYPERAPVWGWKTSTPEAIKQQIDIASDAGLDFFTFCWYFNPNTKGKDVARDAKNNALNLYLKAPNKEKLSFSLLIANHGGYAVKAAQWNELNTYWVNLFKDSSYLRLDGKPLITFFDIQSLVKTFGTADSVSIALDQLRTAAKQANLPGVSIAVNIGANQESVELAEKCGFDILTGYNYHNDGLRGLRTGKMPLDSMRTREQAVWNDIARWSSKPLIPAITLNWDRRPWDTDSTASSPYFQGYSGKSVEKAIRSCRYWMKNNARHLPSDQIAVLYAWNEYGEGAWLTPSESLKNSLLEGVKKGLN